jgi:hypothetical protein
MGRIITHTTADTTGDDGRRSAAIPLATLPWYVLAEQWAARAAETVAWARAGGGDGPAHPHDPVHPRAVCSRFGEATDGAAMRVVQVPLEWFTAEGRGAQDHARADSRRSTSSGGRQDTLLSFLPDGAPSSDVQRCESCGIGGRTEKGPRMRHNAQTFESYV